MFLFFYLKIESSHIFLFRSSAWVVLGKPRSENPKAYTENGFQGHLTKVQVWGRALDVTNEIQKQVRTSLNVLILNLLCDIMKYLIITFLHRFVTVELSQFSTEVWC